MIFFFALTLFANAETLTYVDAQDSNEGFLTNKLGSVKEYFKQKKEQVQTDVDTIQQIAMKAFEKIKNDWVDQNENAETEKKDFLKIAKTYCVEAATKYPQYVPRVIDLVEKAIVTFEEKMDSKDTLMNEQKNYVTYYYKDHELTREEYATKTEQNEADITVAAATGVVNTQQKYDYVSFEVNNEDTNELKDELKVAGWKQIRMEAKTDTKTYVVYRKKTQSQQDEKALSAVVKALLDLHQNVQINIAENYLERFDEKAQQSKAMQEMFWKLAKYFDFMKDDEVENYKEKTITELMETMAQEFQKTSNEESNQGPTDETKAAFQIFKNFFEEVKQEIEETKNRLIDLAAKPEDNDDDKYRYWYPCDKKSQEIEDEYVRYLLLVGGMHKYNSEIDIKSTRGFVSTTSPAFAEFLDITARGSQEKIFIAKSEPQAQDTWLNNEDMPRHQNVLKTPTTMTYENANKNTGYATYVQITQTEVKEKIKMLTQNKYTFRKTNKKMEKVEAGDLGDALLFDMTQEEKEQFNKGGDTLYSFIISFDSDSEPEKFDDIKNAAGKGAVTILKKVSEGRTTALPQRDITIVKTADDMSTFLEILTNFESKDGKTRLERMKEQTFQIHIATPFDKMQYYVYSKIEENDRETVSKIVEKYLKQFYWAVDIMTGISNLRVIVTAVSLAANPIYAVVQSTVAGIFYCFGQRNERVVRNKYEQIKNWFEEATTEKSEYQKQFTKRQQDITGDEKVLDRNLKGKIIVDAIKRMNNA